MATVAVRLDPHDIAALSAYAAVMGLKGPGAALRAIAQQKLGSMRRELERVQKLLADNRSYFTDAKA